MQVYVKIGFDEYASEDDISHYHCEIMSNQISSLHFFTALSIENSFLIKNKREYIF